jgi:hypothetical protein
MSEEHTYTLHAATMGTEAALWITCSCGWEHELGATMKMEDLNKVCDEHNPYVWWPWVRLKPGEVCPDADRHRPPQGPNEDTGQCSCGTMSFAMRPWGETFGTHLDDCSLPIDHESYCQPGGSGHPPARKIRG